MSDEQQEMAAALAEFDERLANVNRLLDEANAKLHARYKPAGADHPLTTTAALAAELLKYPASTPVWVAGKEGYHVPVVANGWVKPDGKGRAQNVADGETGTFSVVVMPVRKVLGYGE